MTKNVVLLISAVSLWVAVDLREKGGGRQEREKQKCRWTYRRLSSLARKIQ